MPKVPGAGLEARFRPYAHWGAEFSAQGVRLCAVAERDGKAALLHSFSGTYAEAEAFAHAHGLAYAGLHAAVSHLPFKLEPFPAAEDNAEAAGPALERARPQGLPPEAYGNGTFPAGIGSCLALVREDSLQAFLKGLPPPLAALWDLAPSPLLPLPFLDAGAPEGVVLLGEPDLIHVLLLRSGVLAAYIKVFSGWEDAARDAAGFSRELKKALVYHFGSRFGWAPQGTARVLRDGPGGEIAAGLLRIGIAVGSVDWGPLTGVPPEFRVAAAAAWPARGEEAPDASFDLPAPASALARSAWMRRTGKLARYGVPALAALALIVCLLGAGALALRWTVQAKARAWSGELGRWDGFQRRKAEVEAELGSMQGMLSRRTALYADLQRIAGRIPAETWLEAWEAECKGGNRCQHRLEGYAASEGRVPEFLSALEKGGAPGPLRLKATEKIKGEAVEQKTGIAANRRDLVRFQLGTSP